MIGIGLRRHRFFKKHLDSEFFQGIWIRVLQKTSDFPDNQSNTIGRVVETTRFFCPCPDCFIIDTSAGFSLFRLSASTSSDLFLCHLILCPARRLSARRLVRASIRASIRSSARPSEPHRPSVRPLRGCLSAAEDRRAITVEILLDGTRAASSAIHKRSKSIRFRPKPHFYV